jgi:glycosyltransferase involved in cell wall biosynthesis
MPTHSRPSVSVVVPVRNETRSINALLDSLCAQTRAPDEVVICDAGSTDNTVKIIEGYTGRIPLRLLHAGPALPGRARNLAIRAASHDVIVLTDAGIRLGKQWLERLVAPFDGPSNPDVVYGRFEPMIESFRQRCIALAFVPPKDPRSGLRTHSLASMAMKRCVWSALGGFREDLRSAEDLLFMRGISTSGFSSCSEPSAVVFWSPPRDFTSAFSRFSAYSYSNLRAGLAREWQIPLMRTYLLTAFLTATMLWTPLGSLAPIAMLLVRAAKRISREIGIAAALHIPTLVVTTFAVAIIDLATFCGSWHWLVSEKPSGNSVMRHLVGTARR